MAQPVEYEQVTYNDPSGAQFGKSATEKIAFYGATPIVKPTVSGSISSGVAISTLMFELANLGLIVNNSAV